MMKILYLTESLPPLTDGVTRTLSHLVETLESEKVDYRFISPIKPDASIPWSGRVHKVASIPLLLYTYYRVALPLFSHLDAEVDRFKPDLIHVVSPTFLGIYGLNYAKSRQMPVVSSYHTHFVDYFSYYRLRRLQSLGWRYLRWFHNRCAMTYAPSPSAAVELSRRGIKNVDLWQHGVDLEKFSPSYRSVELRRSIGAENIPILLFIGRLVKEKDLDDLVHASHLLRLWGNTFRLVIVGDGPMRDDLRRSLPEAHFTGYQYGHELSRWYASADIFVFPSTTETFGNVILEAMASGIPVVGVDKGGVADIITPGMDGLLVKPNAPRFLAEKIQNLLKDASYARRLGQQARLTAANYRWQTNNKRLLASYADIIAHSRQNLLKHAVRKTPKETPHAKQCVES